MTIPSGSCAGENREQKAESKGESRGRRWVGESSTARGKNFRVDFGESDSPHACDPPVFWLFAPLPCLPGHRSPDQDEVVDRSSDDRSGRAYRWGGPAVPAEGGHGGAGTGGPPQPVLPRATFEREPLWRPATRTRSSGVVHRAQRNSEGLAMDVGAIVLCGGESRRMGRPKAWLPFGPERLLQRVVRIVGEAAGPVVVVAAAGQDLPTLPAGVAVVFDEVSGRGPLLRARRRPRCAGRPRCASRSPRPSTPPGSSPAGSIGSRTSSATPTRRSRGPADGLHPLSALYRPATVRPAVARMIAEGRFRATEIVGRVRTREVGADDFRDVDPDLGTLANLNTPEEYRAALLRAGFAEERFRLKTAPRVGATHSPAGASPSSWRGRVRPASPSSAGASRWRASLAAQRSGPAGPGVRGRARPARAGASWPREAASRGSRPQRSQTRQYAFSEIGPDRHPGQTGPRDSRRAGPGGQARAEQDRGTRERGGRDRLARPGSGREARRLGLLGRLGLGLGAGRGVGDQVEGVDVALAPRGGARAGLGGRRSTPSATCRTGRRATSLTPSRSAA